MRLLARVRNVPTHLLLLNTLHILNDGYGASFMLLLPFIATAQHISLVQVGILGTVLNVASLLIAMPTSTIAAKLGSFRTLTLAMIGYGLAIVGVGIYSSLPWQMIMFAMGGVCFGLFHPIAIGLIAKWSIKENRGRMMGDFIATGDIGRIGIAAALSFLIVYLGWHLTIFLYAGVALSLGVTILIYLRRNHERVQLPDEQKPLINISAWQMLKNRRFVFAVGADAIDTFVADSFYVFLPFLLLARGVNPALLGALAAAYFVGNILGKTVMGRFADKTGAARVFVVSEIAMAGFIFILANSTWIPLTIVCTIILGILTKGTIPVVKVMIAESVEHHGNYEKAYAIDTLAERAFKTVAPITLGVVASSFGIITTFLVMAGLVLLAVIPATMYLLASRQPHAHTKQARA